MQPLVARFFILFDIICNSIDDNNGGFDNRLMVNDSFDRLHRLYLILNTSNSKYYVKCFCL